MKNVVANWTTNYIYKFQCLSLIKVRVLMKSRFHFSIIHKCMAHVPKCYILSPSYIRFCAARMEIQLVCTYLFKKENKIKRFLNWYSNVHWPNRIRCSSFLIFFLYECDLIYMLIFIIIISSIVKISPVSIYVKTIAKKKHSKDIWKVENSHEIPPRLPPLPPGEFCFVWILIRHFLYIRGQITLYFFLVCTYIWITFTKSN